MAGICAQGLSGRALTKASSLNTARLLCRSMCHMAEKAWYPFSVQQLCRDDRLAPGGWGGSTDFGSGPLAKDPMVGMVLQPVLDRGAVSQDVFAGRSCLLPPVEGQRQEAALLNPFRSKLASAVIENARLLVHSQEPFNAEPPTDRLRAAFLTPQHEFYVRCHGSIPVLDEAAHRLRVEGQVARRLELGLEELRDRFPVPTVLAA